MDKDIQNLLTTLQTTEGGMKQWVKELEEWAASSKIFPVATKHSAVCCHFTFKETVLINN